MRKLLCLTLSLLMILSLCACGGSGAAKEEEKPQLEIGFGRVNITPNYSVGMSASGDEKNRRSTGLISYLYATCVAVKYGQETYLMYTVDTISIDETLGDIIRVEILNEFPELKLETGTCPAEGSSWALPIPIAPLPTALPTTTWKAATAGSLLLICPR